MAPGYQLVDINTGNYFGINHLCPVIFQNNFIIKKEQDKNIFDYQLTSSWWPVPKTGVNRPVLVEECTEPVGSFTAVFMTFSVTDGKRIQTYKSHISWKFKSGVCGYQGATTIPSIPCDSVTASLCKDNNITCTLEPISCRQTKLIAGNKHSPSMILFLLVSYYLNIKLLQLYISLHYCL